MSKRSPTKHNRVSYVEEANDDTGSVIAGTERYAVSEAPSPSKERSNTSKSRKHRPSLRPQSGSGSSSPHNALTDSDSTVHAIGPSKKDKEARYRAKEKERTKEKDKAKERERERRRELEREAERAARKASVRPPTKHSKTTPAPILHSHSQSQDAYRRPTGGNDDAAYYGVSPSASHRPRAMTASRPSSYYGAGSRPPTSNTQWWSQHLGGVAPPPLYPAPSYGSSPAPYPPPSAAPQVDYFGGSAMGGPQHQHLAQRFQRPSSASGHRPNVSAGQPFDPAPMYPYEEYEQENDISLVRRPSLKKYSVEEDRRRMPPPPRPVTTGPRRAAIRGPPPPSAPPVQPRRAIDYGGFDDGDFDGEDILYREIVPSRSISYGYGEGAQLSRSQRRESAALEGGIPYRIEPAASSGRRHSYYGSSAGSFDYEDKFRAAAAYQDDINGGATLPLTAETLRKAGKRNSDKSSRSTRSSESRDESDNRQSNTTRTTRSSAGQGDDDFTIKVTGSATLKVGGAEIHCEDGGEINITQQGGGGSRAGGGGSDRASTIYGEDQRRGRLERLPIRARSSSQAPSSIYGRSPSYEAYGRPPFF